MPERSVAVDSHLQRAAELFGTPSYVYFTSAIEERVAQLNEAFGGRFSLSFAVKSNPNPALLGWLKDRVAFLDVSSVGELRLALQAGWEASRLSFTGPGKRDFEIREGIERGIGELILESRREAVLADQIARSSGITQDVMIRIAPSTVPSGFGDRMAGRPSAFGFDWEDIPVHFPEILAMPNLRVKGLHIFSGTQCLKPDAIVENYKGFISIFREICAADGLHPEKLIFGSGLGIPYHDGDVALNLDAVGSAIAGDLDMLKREPLFAHGRLVLELGRFLVGDAGYFLTRVISIKESRGSRIAICDGGMNNHLPATGHFGMVIKRNYRMHKVGGGEATEKVDLVGPLCTSIDRLASAVMLPALQEGDLIAVHNSGAYGLTASPIHFISHAPPREVLINGNVIQDVTRPFDREALP